MFMSANTSDSESASITGVSESGRHHSQNIVHSTGRNLMGAFSRTKVILVLGLFSGIF